MWFEVELTPQDRALKLDGTFSKRISYVLGLYCVLAGQHPNTVILLKSHMAVGVGAGA